MGVCGYKFQFFHYEISPPYSAFQVVITNMDTAVMDLDAKKWPDAPADDASSFYKVCFKAPVCFFYQFTMSVYHKFRVVCLISFSVTSLC